MMLWSAMFRQAARNAFSVVGRRARISYAEERAGSLWFSEGSEMCRVQRRRRVVFEGIAKGGARGIGFMICVGSVPVIIWLRARISYPDSERKDIIL